MQSVPHQRSHLAHPGDADSRVPWLAERALCGERIVVGMPYREVSYAAENPDNENCPSCDFALFVERNEAGIERGVA